MAERLTVGINFESGKIIDHILKCKSCIAFANIQIAMDAPYKGRVADDALRNKGRSEQQFDVKYGYDERKLKHTLYHIFEYIKNKYPDTNIVLQIARGKAAESTYEEVLKPIFTRLNIINNLTNFINKEGQIKKYKSGYRTTDYYIPTTDDNFIFVNYGMFAVLTNDDNINVGKICNPIYTGYVELKNNKIELTKITTQDETKNILIHLGYFEKLYLMGITDDMPFVTPDKYKEEDISNLIKQFIS